MAVCLCVCAKLLLCILVGKSRRITRATSLLFVGNGAKRSAGEPQSVAKQNISHTKCFYEAVEQNWRKWEQATNDTAMKTRPNVVLHVSWWDTTDSLFAAANLCFARKSLTEISNEILTISLKLHFVLYLFLLHSRLWFLKFMMNVDCRGKKRIT